MSRFDLVLLLLRLTVGVTLMAHGYNKFKGGLAGTGRWFESIGFISGAANTAGVPQLLCATLLALATLPFAGPALRFLRRR